MNKRVFLIVLDSFGIGEAPDAADFGDAGANTLLSISKSPEFSAPNMGRLGLFNIDSVTCCEKTESPAGAYARLSERSAGKDTTVGHWEIAGVVSHSKLPTYPDGFPEEIIEAFSQAVGRGVLCNKPYSGTAAIADFGEQHMQTGDLIVYTSADSVFQIAAHEQVVPVETLYEYCRIARKILTGRHSVGRVIARPFVGDPVNGFTRTSNRHDFSLEPTGKTVLDYIKEAGLDCLSVGKINDIFAGRGITEYVYTTCNSDGVDKTLEYMNRDFNGLCFTNLVDFDMLYGHRNDVDGYARAIAEFDRRLPQLVEKLRENDLLIITADHGCDPGFTKSTDHTREYIPMLAYSKKINPVNLGTLSGFGRIGKTVCDFLGVPNNIDEESFLGEIYGK